MKLTIVKELVCILTNGDVRTLRSEQETKEFSEDFYDSDEEDRQAFQKRIAEAYLKYSDVYYNNEWVTAQPEKYKLLLKSVNLKEDKIKSLSWCVYTI